MMEEGRLLTDCNKLIWKNSGFLSLFERLLAEIGAFSDTLCYSIKLRVFRHILSFGLPHVKVTARLCNPI